MKTTMSYRPETVAGDLVLNKDQQEGLAGLIAVVCQEYFLEAPDWDNWGAKDALAAYEDEDLLPLLHVLGEIFEDVEFFDQEDDEADDPAPPPKCYDGNASTCAICHGSNNVSWMQVSEHYACDACYRLWMDHKPDTKDHNSDAWLQAKAAVRKKRHAAPADAASRAPSSHQVPPSQPAHDSGRHPSAPSVSGGTEKSAPTRSWSEFGRAPQTCDSVAK